jgi:C-terminal processing protease CtpA/Prc
VHATPDEETVMPPVVVLVNEGSSGAAEALAAVLREGGVAVLVGSRTAGQAYVFREVPLPEGRTLRVASDPVLVGDGKSIAGGLVPDIEVTISLADERKYLADPYAVLPGAVAGTALRAERSEVNEAELMRQRQSGTGPRLSPGAGATPPARLQDPVVQDPALARALDLLKGIAVVGRGR